MGSGAVPICEYLRSVLIREWKLTIENRFLHWEDLVEFNSIRMPGLRPTLENGPEACGGLMKMELKLDMRLKNDPTLQPKSPICDDLPMLYFSGISRSWDFQMATAVRGSVCLAAGGREVRWRYIV